jgi:hypothetical protein
VDASTVRGWHAAGSTNRIKHERDLRCMAKLATIRSLCGDWRLRSDATVTSYRFFFAQVQRIPEHPVRVGALHHNSVLDDAVVEKEFLCKASIVARWWLWREDRGDRVLIAGNLIKFFEGQIELSEV